MLKKCTRSSGSKSRRNNAICILYKGQMPYLSSTARGTFPPESERKRRGESSFRATSMERGSRRALGFFFFCGFAGRAGNLGYPRVGTRDFTLSAELGRVDGSGTFEFGPDMDQWANLRIARGGWPTKEGPIRTGLFCQSRQRVMDENGNFWFYVIFDLITASISKWDS